MTLEIEKEHNEGGGRVRKESKDVPRREGCCCCRKAARCIWRVFRCGACIIGCLIC